MIHLLSALAHAEDFDAKPIALDLFASTTVVRDPAWDLFSENDVMPAFGVRLGARPLDRVVVSAGWSAVRRGAELTTDGFPTGSIAAATGHQFTLGARADLSIEDVLLPSLGVNGVALPMRWRFDGDPDHAGDATEFSANGSAFGVEILGGAELRVPPGELAAVAVWMELGGSVYSRATFDDAGTMRPGGFVFRGGLGLRF